MSTELPTFPLDGPGLRQFLQYMWEFLHDSPPEDRSLIWQEWMPRAYEVGSEDLVPNVEEGIRNLAKEFRHANVSN